MRCFRISRARSSDNSVANPRKVRAGPRACRSQTIQVFSLAPLRTRNRELFSVVIVTVRSRLGDSKTGAYRTRKFFQDEDGLGSAHKASPPYGRVGLNADRAALRFRALGSIFQDVAQWILPILHTVGLDPKAPATASVFAQGDWKWLAGGRPISGNGAAPPSKGLGEKQRCGRAGTIRASPERPSQISRAGVASNWRMTSAIRLIYQRLVWFYGERK
jgi:hypothetical protein